MSSKYLISNNEMLSALEEEALLVVCAMEEVEKLNEARKTRMWSHEMNLQREEKGEFYTLVPDLLKDEKRFFIYFRMKPKNFNIILAAIRSTICKQCTNWRKPISPEERLAITLRYLVTGDTFHSIGQSYRVGFSTVCAIVVEVCLAIWNCIQQRYMPAPTTDSWKRSAERFHERWGFPHCVGAIDGKHVAIKCPKNAGSSYFNYLKHHSIVLLAVVGANYEFEAIDVGAYGRNSDGGIFEESAMGQKFISNQFNLPADTSLPGQSESTPYYNLCRARRVVENAFGILAMKWRIFLRPIEMKAENIKHIVSAACLLHNMLREENYEESELKNKTIEASPMTSIQHMHPHRSNNNSCAIRDRFVKYFDELD